MGPVIPKKLSRGGHVRVIAPSRSLALISKESRAFALRAFTDQLGLNLSFGTHCEESSSMSSASIESRVADLHEAFTDPGVNAVFTCIGGYNSNQLLPYIDWDLIAAHPKIFCGYSDITVLQNAMLAKAQLVTYSGPHYSTFGQKQLDPFTVDYTKKCLFESEPYDVLPSAGWTDDEWWINQNARRPIANKGYWTIQEGAAEGIIIGGNLSSFVLLHGSEYAPHPQKILLFIEDDAESNIEVFDRQLESLLQQKYDIQGVVIGRFQKASEVTQENLKAVIEAKRQLQGVPVVANADFGHTNPLITYPIGGTAQLEVVSDSVQLRVRQH